MEHTNTDKEMVGVAGFFDDEHELLKASAQVRDHMRDKKSLGTFDVFTPYPVHGLDEAQGLERSKIPYVAFAMGLTGTICAFALEYWTSAVDWPLIVGGKPFNSWPAFVPVMFELTILFAGLSTFAAMILTCRLPSRGKSFDPSITRDRFAIVVEKGPVGAQFSEKGAADLLKAVGAKDIKTVFAEGWF